MNILNDTLQQDRIRKSEVELVQKKKHEYYLLGSFLRTKGLKIYGYNHIENIVFEIIIKYSNTIHLVPVDGKPTLHDFEAEKTFVDSKFQYFEALNYKSAKKRVEKYKTGLISELNNLRRPDGDYLKLQISN